MEHSNTKTDKDIIAENIIDRYSSAVSANIVNTNLHADYKYALRTSRVVSCRKNNHDDNKRTKHSNKNITQAVLYLIKDIWVVEEKTKRLELGLQYIKIVKSIPQKSNYQKTNKQFKKHSKQMLLQSRYLTIEMLNQVMKK